MPAVKGPTKTIHWRDFSGGMNQTDSQPSLKDNEVWWAENVQIIGRGNLRILPPVGTNLTSVGAGISKMFGVTMKIGGSEVARLITINNDGSMTAIDPTTGTQTTIAAASTVTGSARIVVWQDTPLLIGDPTNGYFSWDGTNLIAYPHSFTANTTNTSTQITSVSSTTGLVAGMHLLGAGIPVGTTIASISGTTITASNACTATASGITITVGSGAPTSVSDISTFEGRTFLVSGSRATIVTAPGSYTDFQTADGAVVLNLTDSVFPGSIKRLLSALEILWVIGPGAVNALSNVQIASGNITTVTNTNIVSNVGTLLPSSVTAFFRTFLFLTPYGVYAIVGATPQKLSENLNNLFKQVTFGTDQPSAVGVINSVFVWAVLVTYTDPSTNQSSPLILCFNRNAWFVASQGSSLLWITSIINLSTGVPEFWGTDGSNVFKLFAGTGAGFYKLTTKQYDFGQFTTRKQALRLDVEIDDPVNTVSMSAKAFNEFHANVQLNLGAPNSTLSWTGASTQALTFTGSASVAIAWVLVTAKLMGAVDMAGDMIGFTFSGTSQPFTISGLAMEIDSLGEWI